jgi:hypothetical protein
MATTLRLQNITPPYIFESLGIPQRPLGFLQGYSESNLFPIGSMVTLTSGTFPFTDYRNIYEHSNLTHVIGGRTVRINGFSDCVNLNENMPCEIHVLEHTAGGKRRRRLTKKHRGKRYRRRGSSRRH